MTTKKISISFFVIITLLIVSRLCLPYALLYYVNNQMNKIPGYKAKIADIDIHLYRGSYAIKNIQLWKMNKKIPVPFFRADVIELSVQWEALFHGKFVAKIWATHPTLNFVVDPKGSNDQLGINVIWIDIAKSLFPLNFNAISIQQGVLSFRSFSSNPPFNVVLKNISMHIHNIQNADTSSGRLPSSFDMEAFASNKTTVNIQGKFNPFAKEPTFYLAGKVENMDVRMLKNLLKSYTAINVEKGNLSLYTEITAADGKIKGYAKPFISNLDITSPKNASPLETVYNGVASLAAKVLENPNKHTIATQINFEGKINDPDKNILSIIFYALRHAFIQALLPQIDHSLKISQVFPQDKIKYTPP